MESLFRLSETEILTFALVLFRVSAFVATWPVFGVSQVPNSVKVLISIGLAALTFPLVGKVDGALLGQESLIWLTIREILIGLCLGYIARFFFFVILTCAHLVSVSMGISSAQIFNPTIEAQISSYEQFQAAIGTLFFLMINGHHMLLKALGKSWEMLPLGQTAMRPLNEAIIAQFIQEVCVIGIQLSAPVMISILFVNVAMGIVGRAVPQINVLVTSIPVNIMIAFVILIISMPLYLGELPGLMNVTTDQMFIFLKSF